LLKAVDPREPEIRVPPHAYHRAPDEQGHGAHKQHVRAEAKARQPHDRIPPMAYFLTRSMIRSTTFVSQSSAVKCDRRSESRLACFITCCSNIQYLNIFNAASSNSCDFPPVWVLRSDRPKQDRINRLRCRRTEARKR